MTYSDLLSHEEFDSNKLQAMDMLSWDEVDENEWNKQGRK